MQPLFFLVTAHGREKLARRTAVEQALPDGHLVKPVTANMLLEALLEAGHSKESPPVVKDDLRSAQQRLPGMRLLLVDDNLINQQVAQELLEAEGAVVDVAANGQEAVEAVAAAGAAYDVVLMDLQMPVMDGFAATRVIRYEMGLKTLPIVAMTANAMASDRDAALAAGMNDHVGKPFDLTQLVQVLRVQAGRGGALAQAVPEGATLPDSVLQVADRVEVDINAALKRLGGKRDVYHRMLQSFVQDLQAMPAQLRTAAPPDGRRIVHTFKGLTATLGARALSARAADLEKAMLVDTDGSSAQYQRAVDDLCNAMVHAQAALAALVDALAQDAGAESSRSDNSGAMNLAAMRGQLQLLVNLLERQDMEALNVMAELQAQWGERGSGESAALEQAMAALDFEAALPLARALEQKFSAV